MANLLKLKEVLQGKDFLQATQAQEAQLQLPDDYGNPEEWYDYPF
jgi:hypothetical protein